MTREADDYENEIADLQNRLDIAEYDKERFREEVTALEKKIKALSVEPCEDTISFPKGTLKKRGKGYVVYDVEWFKKNWRTELKVMGVEWEDAISRDYLLSIANTDGAYGYVSAHDIAKAPSVTPKQKMGRWEYVQYDGIQSIGNWHCSECRGIVIERVNRKEKLGVLKFKYCPNCGAKMSNIPTGSNCTDCVLDGTDACSRGAGRAVDGRVCEDFVRESEG